MINKEIKTINEIIVAHLNIEGWYQLESKLAFTLYNAGYRRSEDVAREIIQVMDDFIEETASEYPKEYMDAIYHKGYMNAIRDWKQYIKKKYGVQEDG